MINSNIELFEVILETQLIVQRVKEMLEEASSHAEDGMFPMPVEAAGAISAFLTVQMRLIRNLAEENQEIFDQLEKFTELL